MSANKKLLVLGGGHADIPLIQAGKRLGFYVITSGNKANDLGHAYSDEYISVDFSDKQAVLALAKAQNISAICASCNDFSALSSAYVAEQMGLPGHDSLATSETIHHKDAYRAFAITNNIATPDAVSITNLNFNNSEIAHLNFPLIVKPVDLTGGKGITRVANEDELREAIAKAFAISKQKRVVVEEFLEGTRHGFTALLIDKKVVFHFSDNEHYFTNPYMVSAASTPGALSQEAIAELIKQSEKIAQLLKLVDGIFHVQFIMHNNYPTIIEICRRSPGDLYIRFVEIATGVPYPELILRQAVGMQLPELENKPAEGYFLRHCVMSANTGIVKDIIYDESIKPSIVEQMMWWKKGDVVQDVMTAKFGIVFMRFNNMQDMLYKAEHMQQLIKVELA